MNIFFKLFSIIFLILLTNKSNGSEPLTKDNIQYKIQDVVRKPLGKSRSKASFAFKDFIETSGNSLQNAKRIAAILKLRQVLQPVMGGLSNDINTINADLRENIDFAIRKRLLSLEIMAQNNNDATMDNLVGQINIGGNSLTGTLIALPDNIGGFTFHVLTCAHVIDAIPTIDNRIIPINPNNFIGDFHIGGLFIGITSIKVFKKQPKNFVIGDTHILSPVNKVSYQTMGALPRYEDLEDIAILDLNPASHAALLVASNIHTVNLTPPATNRTLSFNSGNNRYNFHFISTLPEANNIVANANLQATNLILGYAAIHGAGMSLRKVGKRQQHPLFPNFINIPLADENQFIHDAPMYWGMSGGPIFYTVHNGFGGRDAHIYGVVKGAFPFDGVSPNWSSQCMGTFLKTGVLP